MAIVYHEHTKTFHLYNDTISYLMKILPNEKLGHLYFGQRIHDKEDFSYLVELSQRPMSSCVYEENKLFSMEHIKQELPVYGTTDYRQPMVEIVQQNGSRISDFCYESHEIMAGKPKLVGLPATYTESDDEAQTLIVYLKDSLTGVRVAMMYTIFLEGGVIAKSIHLENTGCEPVYLTRAFSMCLDLPDSDYEWLQLSGAWARERHIITRKLVMGIQEIGSIRGNSSHNQNPFMVLKRPSASERQGEVIGFSFVYSGNFSIQAEVDAYKDSCVLGIGAKSSHIDAVEKFLDYIFEEVE